MLNVTVGGDVRILPELKFKTKFSYYFFDRQRYRYNPSTLPSRTEGMGGWASRENYGEQTFYVQNTLEYSIEKNRHHFDVTAGQTYRHFDSHNFSLAGEGYIVDAVKWNNMGAVANKESYGASTNMTKKEKVAFFLRANYNWKKRYYVTFTGRVDGAS